MTIEQIIEQAHRLALIPYEMQHPKFKSIAPVYIAPTSNVKAACQVVGNAQTVLAVGSMGAIGFEMALNGAKKIDLFDINILQRMFFEMVKAAIINFDYETFIKFFSLPYQSETMPRDALSNFLSIDMYLRLRNYLPSDVAIVYDYLYSNFDSISLLMSSVYRYEFDFSTSYLRKFSSLYNKKTYYELQAILRANPNIITYQTASLIDVPKTFSGTYDAVILDNILQYYNNFPEFATVSNVDEFIKGPINDMLNPGGIAEVNYGYELRTAAMKRMLNMPYNKKKLVTGYEQMPPQMAAMYSDILTEKEIKEGISTNLYNMGGYNCHFFKGVEVNNKSDNFVLTYTRSR